MKTKKAWLDILYYDIGKQQHDYLLCGTFEKKGETLFTKWKKYSDVCFPVDFDEDWKIKWVNQRQILPIEIVLDLEEKSQLKPIVRELKEMQINFYVFSTGSRGYHIHIFFNKEISPEDKLSVLKYFKVDTQKYSEKTMIALEYSPHWKSGKLKEEVLING